MAPLLLCASLARFWGMSHSCQYLWLTDSKAAISTVTVVTRLTATPCRYPNDIDYVTAICELHKSLGGCGLKTKWIKGHQDDRQEYNELSSESQTQC